MGRTETIDELNSALSAIYQITQCQAELIHIQAKVEEVEKKAKDMETGGYFGCMFWLLTPLFGVIGARIMQGHPGWGFFIGLVCGGVLWYLLNIPNSKHWEQKAQDYYDENIPPLMDALEMNAQYLEELNNSPQIFMALDPIPSDYLSIEAVQALIQLLENQRADTLKEAINLYENILHQRRLEIMQQHQINMAQATLQLQSEQLSVVQYQAKINESIAKSNKQIASNTKKVAKSARYGNIVNTINTVHHWKK